MPLSQSTQLSTILGIIERNKPKSLLDVGIGMGQYGFLARTNLEAHNLFRIDGDKSRQTNKEEWRTRIDGIEGCEGYLTPVHEYAYNKIMIGEAIETLRDLPDNSYEMVVAIDILEHFHKEDGMVFIRELKRVASGLVLISTPKEFIEQEFEENPYETHRSLWTQDDLSSLSFNKFFGNQISWIALYRPEWEHNK